jgi:hypothetical protein
MLANHKYQSLFRKIVKLVSRDVLSSLRELEPSNWIFNRSRSTGSN